MRLLQAGAVLLGLQCCSRLKPPTVSCTCALPLIPPAPNPVQIRPSIKARRGQNAPISQPNVVGASYREVYDYLGVRFGRIHGYSSVNATLRAKRDTLMGWRGYQGGLDAHHRSSE